MILRQKFRAYIIINSFSILDRRYDVFNLFVL